MGKTEKFLPNDDRGRRRIAVIGAGPAGLVTAKTLMERGFEVTVYEKGSFVGGTWVYENDNGRRFLYKNLHINTSKRLTAFSGLPFPEDTQPIPDHHDMARYFAAYADRFGLMRRIRFRSPVRELSPVPIPGSRRPKWQVTADNQAVEVYDAAVVCAGAFEKPKHATALQAFAGEYLHSADYREPERYVGKRVCIVGAGNSAVDIASDLCTTAKSVTLVARSAVKIVPHFVAGRSLNDIGRSLQKRWIPDSFRRLITQVLVYIVHGSEVRLGFKPLTHRVHPTISSTIVQDILFGRVKVRQDISTINGSTIIFADGTQEDFDVIIGATGYVTEFPFLSRDILETEKDHLDLYLRIVAPDWLGLYFVGLINIDTPINFACEQQARWVAAIEHDRAALPASEEMRRQIAAKNAWVSRYYGTAARHSVQEESKIYYRELNIALRKARKRGTRAEKQSATRTPAHGGNGRPLGSEMAAAANDLMRR